MRWAAAACWPSSPARSLPGRAGGNGAIDRHSNTLTSAIAIRVPASRARKQAVVPQQRPTAASRPRALSRKSYFAVLLLTLAAAARAQSDARAREVCAQIQPIAVELTKISGMPLKHPVPCGFISRDKINTFLNQRVKEVAKISGMPLKHPVPCGFIRSEE